ncbi:MAG: SPOR domain-containing protein [Candidatus Omnitrophica bacterium]|nr:SPOR domain-containing protein [Candidatus Omnitrophota bacterium]
MSLYADALHKLSEKKIRRTVLAPYPEPKKPMKKRYVFLWIFITLVGFYFIYVIGFYQGMRLGDGEGSQGAHIEEAKNLEPPSGASLNEIRREMGTEPAKEADEVTPVKKPVPPYEKLPPYHTIQLVTYRTRDRAEQEVKMLKGKGFSAFVIPGAKFYSVCVEKYDDNDMALNRMYEIKKLFGEKVYRDAFVRYIREQ